MRKVKIIHSTIVFLLILLFAYTGISKLLSYEQTVGTLAAVKIIGDKAEWVGWLVPVIEILVAVLLSIDKTRRLGLYSSAALMVIFTLYVFYILRLSGDVPCTCGGVISLMKWNHHLYFNIVFLALSILGINTDCKLSKHEENSEPTITQIV